MEKFSNADAERRTDATLSLGMSASLKDRIEAAAQTQNVSVDAWALRVMEEALRPPVMSIDMFDGAQGQRLPL